ncbi:MAG: MGMT family protein [Ruminococcus callidus]
MVGANGKLGGYFGNDRRKIDLLTLEGQDMRGFRF